MNPNIQNPIQAPIEKPKNNIWGIIYDVILTIVYLFILYQTFLPYINPIPNCGGMPTFAPCDSSYVPINKIITPIILITFLYLSRILRNYKKIFGFIILILSSLILFNITKDENFLFKAKLLEIPPLAIFAILGTILFLSKNSTTSFKKRILIQIFLLSFLFLPRIYRHFFYYYGGCEPASCISENPNGILVCPPGTIKVGDNRCE